MKFTIVSLIYNKRVFFIRRMNEKKFMVNKSKLGPIPDETRNRYDQGKIVLPINEYKKIDKKSTNSIKVTMRSALVESFVALAGRRWSAAPSAAVAEPVVAAAGLLFAASEPSSVLLPYSCTLWLELSAGYN